MPLVTDAINQLKSVGIATVIASGNSGSASNVDQMSWPACISSAVSVGNTVSEFQSNQPAYPVDSVWLDSNISAVTDLLAPGTKINTASSTASNSYAETWGTSLSAPHVAGAFAVLKSKNTALSVDTLLTALKDSGVNVTDQRAGGIHTVPRIDVGNALNLVPNGNTTFQGLTPNGTTTGVRPTFTWTPLPGQTDYWVIADNTSLDWPYVVYQTISATAANCASGTCSYTSPVDFAPGVAVWKVQAPQSSGAWPETSLLNFTVNSGGTFQGLTPNGNTTGVRPTFTWTPLPGQTDYWVIADNTSLDWPYVVYQAISASVANCASGTCSYTSPVDFAPGAAVWKVQAPQSSGAWPETSLLNFTVN